MNQKIFMIIDDDIDDRFFLKEGLKELFSNFVCFEAKDGADGLSQLRKAEPLPSIIFLDVNMPLLDGRECLKELKKDAKLNTIPVIMYSTFFSKESITEFYTLGASSYLKKPTDMNKLPAQILEAISGPVKLP